MPSTLDNVRSTKMDRSHFEFLAHYLGGVLGRAYQRGGEKAYEIAYNESYTPMVNMLKLTNSNFDNVRFSFAVAQAAENYRNLTAAEQHSWRVK